MTNKWTTFFVALITSLPGAAQTVNCPATADTWVSVPEDRQAEGVDNHGTDTRLSIRGRESLALLQFDVSGLKGRKIAKAVLRIHRENADPVPLHTVGLSTISGTAAWAEGARKDGPAAPGESNYFFARVGQQPWSYPGSDVTDVTFGQGGSLYSYERARDAGNGWYEIDIPVGIVAALVSGDQFGIMLTDEKGQTHTNHLINSRESQYPPVLIVSTPGAEKGAPGPVQTRPIETTPVEARKLGHTILRPGSVILNFGGAGNTAHYERPLQQRAHHGGQLRQSGAGGALDAESARAKARPARHFELSSRLGRCCCRAVATRGGLLLRRPRRECSRQCGPGVPAGQVPGILSNLSGAPAGTWTGATIRHLGRNYGRVAGLGGSGAY